MTDLSSILSTGTIGRMSLRNRLVMGAIGGAGSGSGPEATQKAINFYCERAKGGAALIVVPSVVSNETNMPAKAADADLQIFERTKAVALALHKLDTRMAGQLNYVTLVSWPGVEQVGPSSIPCYTHQMVPRALHVAEIQGIVQAYGDAATRLKQAGCDAIEIQAAHGFFLSAFLSPYLNRRTDQYGGSTENRARFVLEVISQVRQATGSDFPLILRMNCSDFIEGGLTNEEACRLASMFARAGVDAIDVSAAIQDSRQWRDLTYLYPDGALVPLAAAIKRACGIPVIAIGKIGSATQANQIIAEGKADFIAMGRALLADPALLEKSIKSEAETVQSCIYCNNCRLERTGPDGKTARGLACTVNPALGKEGFFSGTPATKPKKVMVIGGGLAGISAARVLAQRGHHVSLFEKEPQLGGQWNTACKLPGRSNYHVLLPRLVRELHESGTEVFLNHEASMTMVGQQKPEVVVVATGAVPLSLDVPGVDASSVAQGIDVINGKRYLGKKVAVIGAGLQGMEIAEMLSQQGKEVTLIARNRIGGQAKNEERNLFVTLRDRLIEHRVRLLPFARVAEIQEKGLYLVLENELLFLPVDDVVVSVGARTENGLAIALKEKVPELYTIGDCARVRDAREAILEGVEVGSQI